MTRFAFPAQPDQWACVPLGKLADIKYGSALISGSRNDTGNIPVFGSGGIVGKHDVALHDQRSIVIGRKGSVGSIYLTDGPFWCIDTAFYLDSLSEQIDLEFLARYLQSIELSQLAISVAVPGLNRVDLSVVPVPIPPLPEQHRIVEVLQLAEDVAQAKRSVSDQVDDLIRALYWQHFGSYFASDGMRSPVPIAELVESTQYGVSAAMGDEGSYAVLRMNSLTTSGWLDLSDLKYANLSEKDAASADLRDGDLLFNRTNSRELVGKCAIWRGAEGQFSFASYLVRLRLKQRILPEYLWATLNSEYGKYRLMNAAKQAVSMANVSPTDLKRITVPLPSLHEQQAFAQVARQVEGLRARMLTSVADFHSLSNQIAQQAVTGVLTRTWRERHLRDLEAAVQTRDVILRERGASGALSMKEAVPVERAPPRDRQARNWLLGELSEFQRSVRKALSIWQGTLLPDDTQTLEDFCRQWPIEHEPYPHDRVRRTLEQLAGLGLIAKVAVLNEAGDFVVGYRQLRPEEEVRLDDAGLLLAILRRSRDATSGQPQGQSTEGGLQP